MTKVHNKLVRDKIPEIIIGNGGVPKTHVLSDDAEFVICLHKKLQEEVAEYFNAKPDEAIEELADILEVIEALTNTQNTDFASLLKIKEAKARKRGGFAKRIYLENVEEENK